MGLFGLGKEKKKQAQEKELASTKLKELEGKAAKGNTFAMEQLCETYRTGRINISSPADRENLVECVEPDLIKAYEWGKRARNSVENRKDLIFDPLHRVIRDMDYICREKYNKGDYKTVKQYAELLVNEDEKAHALYLLSQLYKKGCEEADVPADSDKYTSLLREAAENGSEDAMDELIDNSLSGFGGSAVSRTYALQIMAYKREHLIDRYGYIDYDEELIQEKVDEWIDYCRDNLSSSIYSNLKFENTITNRYQKIHYQMNQESSEEYKKRAEEAERSGDMAAMINYLRYRESSEEYRKRAEEAEHSGDITTASDLYLCASCFGHDNKSELRLSEICLDKGSSMYNEADANSWLIRAAAHGNLTAAMRLYKQEIAKLQTNEDDAMIFIWGKMLLNADPSQLPPEADEAFMDSVRDIVSRIESFFEENDLLVFLEGLY